MRPTKPPTIPSVTDSEARSRSDAREGPASAARRTSIASGAIIESSGTRGANAAGSSWLGDSSSPCASPPVVMVPALLLGRVAGVHLDPIASQCLRRRDVGHRALRMLVPARVALTRELVAHLHDREHAAHRDHVERAAPA